MQRHIPISQLAGIGTSRGLTLSSHLLSPIHPLSHQLSLDLSSYYGLINSKHAHLPLGHLLGIFSPLLPPRLGICQRRSARGWGIVKNNSVFRTCIWSDHNMCKICTIISNCEREITKRRTCILLEKVLSVKKRFELLQILKIYINLWAIIVFLFQRLVICTLSEAPPWGISIRKLAPSWGISHNFEIKRQMPDKRLGGGGNWPSWNWSIH